MKKVLLASLSTIRDGEKVRFPANQVADVTKDEIKLLDRMTATTGRPHYRDPVNEGGDSGDDEGRQGGGENDAFDGESVEMDDKNVDQLKAYLDHNSVSYETGDKKADLLKRAKAHESDGGL